MAEFNFMSVVGELRRTVERLPDESRTAFDHRTAGMARQLQARERALASMGLADWTTVPTPTPTPATVPNGDVPRDARFSSWEEKNEYFARKAIADARPVEHLTVHQERLHSKQAKLLKAKDKYI